ncbi:hypothetical protein RB653_004446 [Dictyostelium firmibasis]|uniref:Uncharacterized protein n=1 Tax=Dictyostelium firmibasis TaxID=79012 RepID=A0AAN7U119_9MYCE
METTFNNALVLGDLLYPTQTYNVLSDFGADEPFLIDGDSLILYLFSSFNISSNNKKDKQLLSTDKCQSILFFHYFESFIANVLNRKTKFQIFFIEENQYFYKNNSLKLIRKLCIDYYINDKTKVINNPNIQFTLIKSKWWEDFSGIESFLLENMFSFMLVLFPTENFFDSYYQTNIQEVFILKTLKFLDYVVEFNSISFEGSSIETTIYGKGSLFQRGYSYFCDDQVFEQIDTLYNNELENFNSDKIKFKDQNQFLFNNRNDNYQQLEQEIRDNDLKVKLFISTLSKSKSSSILNRVYCIYLVLLESLSIRDRGFILPSNYKIHEDVIDYLENISYKTLLYSQDNQEIMVDLDSMDFKLFYQILIQIQSRLPKNLKELSDIFGDEVIVKCVLIWENVKNGIGEFGDFELFSKFYDDNNNLDDIIKEMKKRTSEINSIDGRIYSVENDFIRSVAPQANEYLKPYKNDNYLDTESTINTRFIDDYHYHSTLSIEPDAFSIKLKETTFKTKKHKQRAEDKSVGSFKKYADSLNDPRNILIINKLNPTKEELEKERIKKEKEDSKKSYRKHSTPISTLKPKNEIDKLLESKINLNKKRYESELVDCKSSKTFLKFLNNFDLLTLLPELYLQYFDQLISFLDEQREGLIEEKKRQVLLDRKQQSKAKTLIELSEDEQKEIENSFELSVKEKSQYYQMVQKYLRLFITERSKVLTPKLETDFAKRLYVISKSLIGLADLSNFINDHWVLKKSKLDESDVGNQQSKNSIEFQLRYSPDTLIRNTGSVEDSRVRHFKPDAWQVELLDIVDKRESALICASTSSGKTFISFYCFEQILKESNDGIVVFVCPTKALVNQMYAEVLGRYEKNYQAINHRPSNNKMVGVFTRDFRLNIETCQILITVPQCLEILFLSIMNTHFIQRCRYIIFDEVHQIASSIDGAVWERLLVFNPAPFLALSATLGNLTDFHNFLKKIDPERKVGLIHYQSRFNDLKNFFLSKDKHSNSTSSYSLEPLHPMATLDQKKTGLSDISPDLKLIAGEAIQMYQVLKEKFGYQRVKHLDPIQYFANIPNKQFNLEKQHVEKYQTELKQFYTGLPSLAEKQLVVKALTSQKYNESLKFDWVSDITNIVLDLQKRELLPALFFSFNRTLCSILAQKVYSQVISRNTNPNIIEQKKQLDLAIEKHEKLLGRALADLEPNDPEKMELERLRAKRASLDFLKPQFGSLLSSDIDEKVKKDPLANALSQGIAAHHSGCDKNYLRNVEYLFRSKKIQVVFATATLAVGVNAPAKSVVFLGDSPYLNVLTSKQCAGRAGRRGFDNYGNVIFVGLPKQKINRLLNSRLSNIIGNSVVSPSLCLTLVSRYDYSINGSNNKSTQPNLEKLKLNEEKSKEDKDKEKEKETEKTKVIISDNWDDDEDDNKKEIIVADNWDDDDEEDNKKGIEKTSTPNSTSTSISTSSSTSTSTTTTTTTTKKLCAEDKIDIQILKKSTKSLLNNSFFLSDPLQVQFQFLFSIDYLYRENYLSKDCVPIDNFSGIVTHLSYLEPYNFSFVSLLKGGVFDNLPTTEKECDYYIIHILSYLFCVQNVPSVYVRSPSILVLPPLPQSVQNVIKDHNTRLLKTFSTYLYIYNQYLKTHNDFLPFSNGSSLETTTTSTIVNKWNENLKELKPSTQNFKTSELLSGVFKVSNLKKLKTILGSNSYFSTRILPYCDINGSPINSYLLDFFKHSQKKPLIEDNKIKESDLWTLLKDFSLILKVIATALLRRNPDSPISLAFSGVATRYIKKFGDNFNF